MREARYWSRPGNPVEGIDGAGADCCPKTEILRTNRRTACSGTRQLNLMKSFPDKLVIGWMEASDAGAHGIGLPPQRRKHALGWHEMYAGRKKVGKSLQTRRTCRTLAIDRSATDETAVLRKEVLGLQIFVLRQSVMQTQVHERIPGIFLLYSDGEHS